MATLKNDSPDQSTRVHNRLTLHRIDHMIDGYPFEAVWDVYVLADEHETCDICEEHETLFQCDQCGHRICPCCQLADLQLQ